MRWEGWVLLGVLAGSQATGWAADDRDEVIRALARRVEELDKKVKGLEEQRTSVKEATAARGQEAPRLTVGAGGLSFASADTNFVVRLRGGVQADGRFYPGDSPGQDTFLLRRVRPIVEGTVYGKFDLRMMFDFASGVSLSAANNGTILDAYGDLRLSPQLKLRAGKFKEPVGLERLRSWTSLTFVERGFPTQLLPNRDTGLMLHGEFMEGRLQYQVGVFNGTADGGSSDFDRLDSNKDLAARLFAEPFKESRHAAWRGLGIGIAGTFGEQERVPSGYSTPGSQRLFGYRGSADPARPNVLGDGTQWRLSPQAQWSWGPFGLLGELAISSVELEQAGGGAGAGTSEAFRNTAWQVQASYVLTGEAHAQRPLSPLRPLSSQGRGWGALEVTARVGEIDPDDAAFPVFADPATAAAKAFSWGVGLNWYLNRVFKVVVNYEDTNVRGRAGDTELEHEHVVLTRLQAAF